MQNCSCYSVSRMVGSHVVTPAAEIKNNSNELRDISFRRPYFTINVNQMFVFRCTGLDLDKGRVYSVLRLVQSAPVRVWYSLREGRRKKGMRGREKERERETEIKKRRRQNVDHLMSYSRIEYSYTATFSHVSIKYVNYTHTMPKT